MHRRGQVTPPYRTFAAPLPAARGLAALPTTFPLPNS